MGGRRRKDKIRVKMEAWGKKRRKSRRGSKRKKNRAGE